MQKGESVIQLQTEQEVLKRCLDEKSSLVNAHEEKIRYLSSILLVSSNNQTEGAPAKKRKVWDKVGRDGEHAMGGEGGGSNPSKM